MLLNRVPILVLLGCVATSSAAADPGLTIYNQDFAVVRDTVPLDLQKGVNTVRFTDTTAHLETDSVILRDPAGKHALQILEQNYRADPVSQELLLSMSEGKTIDFLVQKQGEPDKIVKGKIIRSPYVMHAASAMRRYGQQYYQSQQRAMAYPDGSPGQPIVEVDGKLRFSYPGQPLFPALADDTILKHTINWIIETDVAGKFDAELAYVTGGMSWEADYNVVSPEKADTLDLVGWVTMDNQSGKTFNNAHIKLMAGDVNKIQLQAIGAGYNFVSGDMIDGFDMRRPVTEKTFDEYHLYTLERPSTLHDRETKQVEFVRAADVHSERVYVYDGVKIDQRYRNYAYENIRQEREYGTQSNPKVWVMREFANSEANHLGIPLPKGRVRFYRKADDGALEFTGENVIDHTPRDEKVRVFTGNAFDIVGERKRTDYKIDTQRDWLDETFEMKLRNHKKEPVEIRVVEHLYRWINWDITDKSEPYKKIDSQTIEFRIRVQPDKEETLTYKVHYTW